MSRNIIEVKDLTKSFTVHHDRPDSIKSLLVNFAKGKILSKCSYKTVLDKISFDIQYGDFVGIMGRNGSGKTTLMKILSGIYVPSSGTLFVKEKLAPMVALGAGFQPELSGYDNVFLNASILGFGKKETQQRIEQIIDFSELGEDIYRPVKNYSSGMIVRLGFSVASLVDAPILLLDEIFAVGDEGFQKKSLKKMEEIFKSGRTVVLVTHDPAAVRKYCTRSIVLEAGHVIHDGSPGEGADIYHKLFV